MKAEPGKVAGEYYLRLVAIPDREVIMYLDEHGKPQARMLISGHLCNLARIYVFAVDRWVGLPKVEYVDLTGFDVKTGQQITERVKQ